MDAMAAYSAASGGGGGRDGASPVPSSSSSSLSSSTSALNLLLSQLDRIADDRIRDVEAAKTVLAALLRVRGRRRVGRGTMESSSVSGSAFARAKIVLPPENRPPPLTSHFPCPTPSPPPHARPPSPQACLSARKVETPHVPSSGGPSSSPAATTPYPVPAARIIRRLCYYANARDSLVRSLTFQILRTVVVDAASASGAAAYAAVLESATRGGGGAPGGPAAAEAASAAAHHAASDWAVAVFQEVSGGLMGGKGCICSGGAPAAA
jgi:hypothetical protein